MSDYVVMTNMSSSEGDEDDSDSDAEMPQDRKEEKEDLKHRQRIRKDEAIYGVLGDMGGAHNHSTGASTDGDIAIAGVGMNRRQRRKLQQERLSKPVGFVSASVNPASMTTKRQQATAAAAQVKVEMIFAGDTGGRSM